MGLLGLGLKLKNVLKAKKVSETITSVKEKYNVGSADKIKKKGKEFKSKMADEAKKAQEAEFKKKPWKDPKKKWDQALREYAKKKK